MQQGFHYLGSWCPDSPRMYAIAQNILETQYVDRLMSAGSDPVKSENKTLRSRPFQLLHVSIHY